MRDTSHIPATPFAWFTPLKFIAALIFAGLALLAFLSVSGCGVGATHCTEDLLYTNGNKLHADYWIYTGHVLSDPAFKKASRNASGAWTIEGYTETTNSQGIAAVFSGLGEVITKYFWPLK